MKRFLYSRLRDFREQAGITQEQLATKIGITKQQISAWENNWMDKSLTTKCLEKIAEALGKQPTDFYVETKKGTKK